MRSDPARSEGAEGPTYADYFAASTLLAQQEWDDGTIPPSDPSAASTPLAVRQQTIGDLAARIAGSLLVATDADTLEDALDAAIESDALRQYLDVSRRFVTAMKFPDRPVGVSISFSVRRRAILGDEAFRICAEVDRVALILVQAMARVSASHPIPAPQPATYGAPTAFLTEPATPVVVKRMLLDALRGIVAHLALRHALAVVETLPAWLAVALANADLVGTKAAVRVFTLMRPGVIPDDLIPDGKIDVRELNETARRTSAWVERACAEADRAERGRGEPERED